MAGIVDLIIQSFGRWSFDSAFSGTHLSLSSELVSTARRVSLLLGCVDIPCWSSQATATTCSKQQTILDVVISARYIKMGCLSFF